MALTQDPPGTGTLDTVPAESPPGALLSLVHSNDAPSLGPDPADLDPAAVMWPTALERIERAVGRYRVERPLRRGARQDRAVGVLEKIDRLEPRKLWIGLASAIGVFALILGPQQEAQPASRSDSGQTASKPSPAEIAKAIEDYKRR